MYTPELAREFCDRVASGRYLHRVAEDPDMPDHVTVYRWLDAHVEFRNMYVRARDIRGEKDAEYMREIADDGRNDWMEQLGEDGAPIGWKLNGEHVQRSRLRVDARKWLMSKETSKYGDRMQLSNDPENPLPAAVAVVHIDYDEIRARLAGKTGAPDDND